MPTLPDGLEFTGTPVQRGCPVGPAPKRACPLSPLVAGKKRRSAPTPPSSPACRSPPAKRQAYEPVNSPVEPTASEAEVTTSGGHDSAATSVAAYSPGWLSPPRFFPSPFSPLVPLAPSPVPSPAPEPTQKSPSPSPRSRSPTMSPQAYEDFILVREFDEATVSSTFVS